MQQLLHNTIKLIHSLVSYLAVQGKLQTTTRLVQIGISNNPLCLTCNSDNEDHQHLFFKCHMSAVCLTELKRHLSKYEVYEYKVYERS